MPVQNDGTGKQKGSAKISEPAKGGGIGENGNERKVGSAGQKVGNESPERTDGAEAWGRKRRTGSPERTDAKTCP